MLSSFKKIVNNYSFYFEMFYRHGLLDFNPISGNVKINKLKIHFNLLILLSCNKFYLNLKV